MNIPTIKNNDESFEDFTYFTRGGMGEIYKGIEKNSNSEVILKLIPIDDTSYEKLLKTEVDVSLSFNNPNIVKTRHGGKIEIEGTQYFYMIQDFYKNGSLKNFIKPNQTLDICFSQIMEILKGMKEISSKIVHRDLKPENILVDDNNHLRVSDFGLAKYIDEQTRTKSFKGWGTRPYMAPECWTNSTNTISMDIYALGIIFYEILTGKLPFNASDDMGWSQQHLFTPMPSVLNNRPDCPVKVNQIIQKMTAKRFNERYSSIDEIIEAFNQAIDFQKTTNVAAERLAMLGNMTLQQRSAQELQKLKEQEEYEKFKQMIDFHIDELFSRVKVIANSVNESLETKKINYYENNPLTGITPKGMTFSFLGKSISFSFCGYSGISDNEENHKKEVNEYWKQRSPYGFVTFHEETSTFFKQNNIILVGIAETNYKVKDGLGNQVEYGFNLALVKKPEDIYGKWYKIAFLANHTKPCFALNLNSLLKKYESNAHNPFYTVDFSILNDDKDLVPLIEKILR